MSAREANGDGTVGELNCRVAIIGAQRSRVAKVLSILLSDESVFRVQLSPPAPLADSHGSLTPAVNIEYLPCVATFDSYTDENGDTVRYLAKIEYHGADGMQILGSSLAPFFDVDEDDGTRSSVGKKSELNFPGISAVVIGCGIETEEDVTMIETFIRSMHAACETEKSSGPIDSVAVESVQPNPDYSSMREENDAYKVMDANEKAEATRCRIMGPGKMANFAFSVAERVVVASVNAVYGARTPSNVEDNLVASGVDNSPSSACESSGRRDGAHENENDPMSMLPPRDSNKVQFACRLCRTILFGEDELEDPPHAKARHDFSRRKHDRGRRSNCESLFLSGELDWMGDMGAMEGKLHCPKCSSKIGLWKWAGAQCSCGTWVTPACQVPLSRVDVVAPFSHGSTSTSAGSVPSLAVAKT